MLTTYFKGLKKNWLIGIIPPVFVVLFIPVIAIIWPELKAQAEAFTAILDNEFYKAFLGDLAEGMFTTWQGMIFMYIFIWLEFIILFMAIFMPVRMISGEVDKKTLDVTLSYPISRWKYLLEKYSVYLTYNFLYPILGGLGIIFFSELIHEPVDLNAVFLAFGGIWLKFFTFGSLSLLCAALFLKTNRSMASAAGIVLGSYIGQRIANLIASVGGTTGEIGEFLANLSMFNYLGPSDIQNWVQEPINILLEKLIPEIVIVFGVGLVALVLALYIFDKRELAY